MKIALIHLTVPLSPEESYRSITTYLVEAWTIMYQRSGTTIEPILLHDGKSIIPKKWPYEVAKLEVEEPEQNVKILDRVNYLKSQLYNQLGKCVVMDWDSLILQDIDELKELTVPMAMPEKGNGYATGLIFLNSPDITSYFREIWWQQKSVAFPHANSKIGHKLDKEYDSSWTSPPQISKVYPQEIEKAAQTGKVIHFEGNKKEFIWSFLSKRGIKW